MCMRSTKEAIEGDHRPQGAPCPFCDKRQRLNEGIVQEWYAKDDMIHHASEYNSQFDDSAPHSTGEQNAEENGGI